MISKTTFYLISIFSCLLKAVFCVAALAIAASHINQLCPGESPKIIQRTLVALNLKDSHLSEQTVDS